MFTFLKDVLHRINTGLGKTEDEYYQAIAKTFLVSCDNAHALHPNHAEKTDAVNFVTMNGGIALRKVQTRNIQQMHLVVPYLQVYVRM